MYQAIRPRQLIPAALATNTLLLLPMGTEYHVGHEQNTPTMPRREPFGSLGASRCPSSGRAFNQPPGSFSKGEKSPMGKMRKIPPQSPPATPGDRRAKADVLLREE